MHNALRTEVRAGHPLPANDRSTSCRYHQRECRGGGFDGTPSDIRTALAQIPPGRGRSCFRRAGVAQNSPLRFARTVIERHGRWRPLPDGGILSKLTARSRHSRHAGSEANLKRREFIRLLGGVAVCPLPLLLPSAAVAQNPGPANQRAADRPRRRIKSVKSRPCRAGRR